MDQCPQNTSFLPNPSICPCDSSIPIRVYEICSTLAQATTTDTLHAISKRQRTPQNMSSQSTQPLSHNHLLKFALLPADRRRRTVKSEYKVLKTLALALLGAWITPAALALQITQLSPKGEIAQIEQVSARFDQPAVPLGDPQATAPLQVSCEPHAKGSGRWLSDRQWVFDFEKKLPPGTRCTAEVASGFRSPEGKTISGTQRFVFGTGGPVVLRTWPGNESMVSEDQHFVVRFAGQVTRQSLLANSWCELEGVGERLPVQWVGGESRTALLKARRIEASAEGDPLDIAVLSCGRRLTPAAQVKLVLGAGLATPSGVVSKRAQKKSFTVREPFSVEFSCQRENAQAACLPLR